MAGSYLTSVIFVTLLCYSRANEEEPACSKFNYDKQMLETMVRLEAKMNKWDREREIFEENVLSVLERRREEMDRKFKKQNDNLDSMFMDYKSIREELKNMTSRLEKADNTPNIAFNAYITSEGNYGNGQILIFPNVLLNEGAGYDKHTGVFTAPVTGLYQFSLHICNYPGAYMVAAIVHGDKKIAITTAYEHSQSTCSSTMAPLVLKKDESVHIKSTYEHSKLRANGIHRWPSFTGVLLKN